MILQRAGVHRASSQTWGSSACARLCSIVIESNNGFAQQVLENRTDLLDLYSKEELMEEDDLGINIIFLAVYYDQPDILRYLHGRGLDLKKPCDPMQFGNPMFYAINLKNTRVIKALDSLGVRISDECDFFHYTPSMHATRLDDENVRIAIAECETKEHRAAVLFYKNYLKTICRRRYFKKLACIVRIQRVCRGMLGRARVRRLIQEREQELAALSSLIEDMPIKEDEEVVEVVKEKEKKPRKGSQESHGEDGHHPTKKKSKRKTKS